MGGGSTRSGAHSASGRARGRTGASRLARHGGRGHRPRAAGVVGPDVPVMDVGERPVTMTRVLVTGSAGFIGSHLAQRFLEEGHEVLGVDGLTPYYDVSLKLARHARLKDHAGFAERILMLEDMAALAGATCSFQPEVILLLAPQTGVPYS